MTALPSGCDCLDCSGEAASWRLLAAWGRGKGNLLMCNCRQTVHFAAAPHRMYIGSMVEGILESLCCQGFVAIITIQYATQLHTIALWQYRCLAEKHFIHPRLLVRQFYHHLQPITITSYLIENVHWRSVILISTISKDSWTSWLVQLNHLDISEKLT